MVAKPADSVYRELGVRRVINAQGNRTLLGGCSMSPAVQRAMDEANQHYVEMEELLARSGAYIAETLGVEAAYITSGCAAALVLGTAGIMTGTDPARIAQLPNTEGMRNEVIFQSRQSYLYKRCFTIPGSRLVEVGSDERCTEAELEAAIGPNTAAVAYLALHDWDDSVVSLDRAVEIAHANGVPVIVDAANQIYPLDYFARVAQAADLVCFGAKYFGSPQSTGIACGKREYVDAVAANSFIGFEASGGTSMGRPMKIDRQEAVGVIAAMKEWFTINHEERLLACEGKLAIVQRGLRDLPHVQTSLMPSRLPAWPTTLRVTLDPEALGVTAGQVRQELMDGTPSIWMGNRGDDTLGINGNELVEGDEEVIVERLREALSARG